MSEIILKAEGDLHDSECRKAITKIIADIDKINTRTKIHTIEIEKINKKLN